MIGRLRLWSGCVLFFYATTHLLNHTLGLASLATADAGLGVAGMLWWTPFGQALLYGSFALHLGAVLWSLFVRRRLRLSRREWLQAILGVSILPLGAIHFAGTRGAYELYGVGVNYFWVIWPMLAGGWQSYLQQCGLLVVVWGHGCIGLHQAFRLRRWYAPAAPVLLAFAVLLPALALAGVGVASREVAAIMADPPALAAQLKAVNAPKQRPELVFLIADGLKIGLFVLLAAVLGLRPLRDLWDRRGGVVRLAYGGAGEGGRVARMPSGLSVLDISRQTGVPHASVCGGRGRCSTCRVRVGGPDRALLPPPSPEEAKVLARIDAPPNVRLACQLRPPPGEYRVTPLLAPQAGPQEAWRSQQHAHGAERTISVLFADIRGFTSLAEGRLPYDTVFILNRYFRAMGEAVQQAGGRLDKFVGDGAMALFGVDGGAKGASEPAADARRAIDAARRMALAIDELNLSLSGEIDEPLRIGIGVHSGPAIVGEMGYGRTVSLTAIGDTVNTASRLETATKDLGCEAVISEHTARLAGLGLDAWPRHEIEVRGRSGTVAVRAVADGADLARPLGLAVPTPPQTAAPPETAARA